MKRIALLIAFAIALLVPGAQAADAPHIFIPITARFVDLERTNPGIGAGVGWQSKTTGFMLMGQVTYDRIDGVAGTVTPPARGGFDVASSLPLPLSNWPRPQPIAYSTPERGVVGVSFTFAIPLWPSVK